MKQEDKQLLLKDLCMRLPYGVKTYYKTAGWEAKYNTLSPQVIDNFLTRKDVIVRPYLRPMSSMTEEEQEEYQEIRDDSDDWSWKPPVYEIDWLLKHHFDFRGLIPKGLAIEVKEGVYEY